MSFNKFYRDVYLPRHPNGVCRWLHLLGIPASVIFVGFVIWFEEWWLLVLFPIPAYFFGWTGHLCVGNHPTFFTHPFLSFRGYWKMIAALVFGSR
jgi:hypothetical protein